MARREQDEQEVLAAFADWRREKPNDAILVATVGECLTERCTIVELGATECSVPGLVGVAVEILEWASERMQGSPQAADMEEAIGRIDLALSALGFTNVGELN